MALTTTAMSLQQLHLQTVQIQNLLHQQTQTDYYSPTSPTADNRCGPDQPTTCRLYSLHMHDGSWSWSQPTPGQTTTTYSLRWDYTTLSGVDTRDTQLPQHQQLLSSYDRWTMRITIRQRDLPTGCYRLYYKRQREKETT